jgi:hypothetical protein
LDRAGHVGVHLASAANFGLSVVVVVGDTGLLDVNSAVVALNSKTDFVFVLEV